MLRSFRALLVAVALVVGFVVAPAHAVDAEKKKPSRPEVWKVRPSSGSIEGGTEIIPVSYTHLTLPTNREV